MLNSNHDLSVTIKDETMVEQSQCDRRAGDDGAARLAPDPTSVVCCSEQNIDPGTCLADWLVLPSEVDRTSKQTMKSQPSLKRTSSLMVPLRDYSNQKLRSMSGDGRKRVSDAEGGIPGAECA